MNLHELTITQAAKGLRDGSFSATNLVQACLDRIAARNETVNAFISVFAEEALAAAAKADEDLAAGNAKPLTGIPFGVKDAICTVGQRSTGAAKILDAYVPSHDATVVAKLKNAGAILIGKQNCDAFGHGASNENSMYGPVKNPHDLGKVSGGSSGGSAAALADNQCLFSVAEDTGGSIRQPAAFCGVVGLRPSYGRNSRYGIMPMGSSLDTVGPMTKTVADLALVQEIMAGHDANDMTTVPDAVQPLTPAMNKKVEGLTVGIPKEYMELEGLDDEVKQAITAQVEALQKQGCTVKEISLPHTKYAIATYYILVPSEDSSNLGRLDGIRYGSRKEGDSLFDVYAQTRRDGFPEEVKRRIMIGTYCLSAGYYDAYYKKAQRVRTKIMQDFTDAFSDVDVIIAPTSPFPAFGIGEKADDPIAMYLADAFVCPAAVAGMPAVSVPAGKTQAGLPIGVQIIAPRLAEERLIQVASAIHS